MKVFNNSDGTIKTIRRDNLQGKIGGLFEKNLLTKNHADVLHEHRFLGNQAVYELDIPSKEELRLAINILEHTLENIYELKYKAEELQWQRELRMNKNK